VKTTAKYPHESKVTAVACWIVLAGIVLVGSQVQELPRWILGVMTGSVILWTFFVAEVLTSDGGIEVQEEK
jgi:hypothetical protein